MPTMQANAGPKFVSLKREHEGTVKIAEPQDFHYPSLYLNKAISGIGENDINETLRAEIKIVPKRITRSETNGKKEISYDIEVREIRIL